MAIYSCLYTCIDAFVCVTFDLEAWQATMYPYPHYSDTYEYIGNYVKPTLKLSFLRKASDGNTPNFTRSYLYAK